MAMEDYSRVINEEEEEKRIQHYSSFQQILLVGEGDFSFSLCLGKSFGCALNIVASSLQPKDEVIRRYKNGKSNLKKLKALGGTVLHGVDATKMEHHPDLQNRKFDRVIFNFPHAGFLGREDSTRVRQKHRSLVKKFFGSASKRLRPDGEIHVTHKTTHPYRLWDLPGLGSQNSLTCIECAEFNIENFPGYSNKRGAGAKCDEPFPLGECHTYKFIFDPSHKNMQRTHYFHVPSQEFQEIPNSISTPICSIKQQPSWIDSQNSPTYVNGMNAAGLPARQDPRSESFRFFKGYLSEIQQKFEFSVRQAMRYASLVVMAETKRLPEAYLKLLREVLFCKESRVFGLQQKLQDLNQRLSELQGLGYHVV